jgi:hypothetical protein
MPSMTGFGLEVTGFIAAPGPQVVLKEAANARR